LAEARAVINVDINTSPAAAALRSLQGQLNAFTTALNRNNTEQALASKGIQRQLMSLVNTSKFFTAEMVRMETGASQLDKTLSKGQVTMGQFFSAKFRKDGLEASRVLSLAHARASALQTQFVATAGAANGFREAIAIRPLHAFNAEAAVSAERLVIQRAMLQQATTSMINFGKNTQWAGRQLMVGFTVPLTIFAATAGKTFMDIEKQAVAFKKVYGDAFTPPEELEANLKAVQELGKEFTKYGIAVSDTMDLAAQAAAAGAKNADLIDATTEATRLATLGQLDQQKALETTIALQSAFALSGEKLAKSINFMNMVENQTVLTLQDLTDAIPRVAPVIQGLGGSVEDMTVMLTAMKEGGITAAQGANALKSGLASLINPTERATEKLQKMGINLNGIVQINRGDLMGTIQDFAKALQTVDEFQRQQALETVFGKFQYARLGALFNNIIKDGSQASRAMDAAAMSAEGLAATANKELGMIEESAATKFTAAMEKLKLAIAPIGEMFVKMATPILNFVSMIAEKFNNLPDFAKNFAALGTVIVGIVIPAGTMFLGLLMNLIGTLTKFGHLSTIFIKGFAQGGIKKAFENVTQATRYMSLAEIDATNAAQQLGGATQAVNQALLDQIGPTELATSAISGLAGAYDVLAQNMREATLVGGLPMQVPGASMMRAGSQRSMLYRPLPIVARNRGGSIPYLSGGGKPTVPGMGNTDTVPAMLTPGEFVVNKKATEQNLGLLHAINSGDVQYRNMGGGIAESGRKFYGMRPNPFSAAAQAALLRQQQYEASRGNIANIFGVPAGVSVSRSRNQSATQIASAKTRSQSIYQLLSGLNTKGSRAVQQLVRLGMSPEELGLKAVGNFILAMSPSANMAMARGSLTRSSLLGELGSNSVYAPIATQIQRYFGKSFNYDAFDSVYRDEIAKLPAAGITNQRFEKASRNALRIYMEQQGYTKNQRKDFLRDILAKDTIRGGAKVGRIREVLNRAGIPFTEKGADIKATINGEEFNFGDVVARSLGYLGRSEGLFRYDKIGVPEEAARVHANKGGMIDGVQGLEDGGQTMYQKLGRMVSLFSTRSGLPGFSVGRVGLNKRFLKESEELGLTPNPKARVIGSLSGAGKYGSFIPGLSLQRGHVAKAIRNGDDAYHPGLMFWQTKDINYKLTRSGATGKELLEDFLNIEKAGLHPASLMTAGAKELGLNKKQIKKIKTAYNRIKKELQKRSGETFLDDDFTGLTESILRDTLDEKTFNRLYGIGTLRVKGKSKQTISFEDFQKRNAGGPILGGTVNKARNFYGKYNAQTIEIFKKWIGSQPSEIAQMKATVGRDKALTEMFRAGFTKSEEPEILQRSTWMTQLPERGSIMSLGSMASMSPKGTPVLQHLMDSKLQKDYEFAEYELSVAQRHLKEDAIKLAKIKAGDLPSWAPENKYFSPMSKKTGAQAYAEDLEGWIIPNNKKKVKETKSTIRNFKKNIPTIIELETPQGTIRANLDDIVSGDNQSFMGRKVSERERILHNANIEILDILDQDQGVKLVKARLISSQSPMYGVHPRSTGVLRQSKSYDDIVKETVRAKARASTVSGKNKDDFIFSRDENGKLNADPFDILNLLRLNPNLSNKDFENIAKYHGSRIRRGRSEREWSTWKNIANILEEKGYPVVQKRNSGGFISPTLRANSGNIVPGVGNTDTVPAMLTPGEFVINKKATEQNLGILHAINSGKISEYALGGIVEVTRGSGEYLVEGRDGRTYGPYDRRTAQAYSRRLIRLQRRQQRDNRQSQRGSFRPSGRGMGLSMGMGSIGGALMMAPMIPGIGQNAAMSGALSGAGMGLSMLSLLPAMGVTGGALAAVVGITAAATAAGVALYKWRDGVDSAARSAAEFGANIGGTANALNKAAEIFQSQTPAQRQAAKGMGFSVEQQQQATQFAGFFDSEQGQAFIEDLKNATSKERFQKLSDYMKNAIASGITDKANAQIFAKTVGAILGDPSLGVGVASAISKQETGSKALLELARGREKEVGQKVESLKDDKVGFAQAAKVIGSSGQIIQDFANAAALAKEDFAAGDITYAEYTRVIEESRNMQIKYTNSISDALNKTNDFGATMQAVKKSLVDAGLATEEQTTALEEAATTTFTEKRNVRGVSGPTIGMGHPASMGRYAGIVAQTKTLDKELHSAAQASVLGGMDINYATELTNSIARGKGPAFRTYNQLIGNVGATEAFGAAGLVRSINKGQVAGLEGNKQATKLVIDFVEEGGTSEELSTFLLSLPEEKRTRIVSEFSDMDQGRRERWIIDYNKIQGLLGSDLSSDILLTAEYKEAGSKQKDSIINGIELFEKLPPSMDKTLAYDLAMSANKGQPLTLKESEAFVKSINQGFMDLQSTDESIVKKISLDILNTMGVDTKNAIAYMDEIQKKIKDFEKLPAQQKFEVLTAFSVLGEAEQAVANYLQATKNGGFDYTTYMGLVRNAETARSEADQAVAEANVAPKIKEKSSGSGGAQKQKSVIEQLKDQFKMLKDVFDGMSKYIKSKTGEFKGIVAGPFGPEFIEYLKSQGEEGIKILKNGGEKLKQAYNEFKKVQTQQAANFAQTFPATLIRRRQDIKIENAFRNKLTKKGFDKDTQDEFIEGIGGVAGIRTYNELTKKRNDLKEKGKQLSKDELNQLKAINQALNLGGLAAKKLFAEMTRKEVADNLKEMTKETENLAYLLSLNYTREQADALLQMGVNSELTAAEIANLNSKMQDLAARTADIAELERELSSIRGQQIDNKEEIRQLEYEIKLVEEINKDEKMSALYAKEGVNNHEDLLAIYERQADIKSREIELEQRKLEPIDEQIKLLEEQMDKVEKSYDTQLEALDKIVEAESEIYALRERTLSLADALSRGDVAAAAQAALELERERASQRVNDQRSLLEQQRQQSIKSIEDQITVQKDKRKLIEDNITRLQREQRAIADQIYNVQFIVNEQAFRLQNSYNLGNNALDSLRNRLEQARLEQTRLANEAKRTADELERARAAQGGGAPPPPPAPSGGTPGGGNLVQTSAGTMILPGFGIIAVPSTPKTAPESPAWSQPGYWSGVFGINKPKGFAYGGKVSYKGSREPAPGFAMGGKVKYFANGGRPFGSDSVPAMLTPGEFVVRRSMAQAYGPLLESINSNVFPRVNMNKAMPSSSAKNDGSMYNYNVNVTLNGSDMDPNDVANVVMQKIKMKENMNVRNYNYRG
jgi:TP901 family phage tail tape measure protein